MLIANVFKSVPELAVTVSCEIVGAGVVGGGIVGSAELPDPHPENVTNPRRSKQKKAAGDGRNREVRLNENRTKPLVRQTSHAVSVISKRDIGTRVTSGGSG